jgi:hypothetical protein
VVELNKLRVYFSWTAVSDAESCMFAVSGVLKQADDGRDIRTLNTLWSSVSAEGMYD